MKDVLQIRNCMMAFMLALALVFSMSFAFGIEEGIQTKVTILETHTSDFPYTVSVQVNYSDSIERNGSLALYYPRTARTFKTFGFTCLESCEFEIPVEEIYLDEYVVRVASIDNGSILESNASFVLDINRAPELQIRGQQLYLKKRQSRSIQIQQTIINKEKLPLQVRLMNTSGIQSVDTLDCGSICYYTTSVDNIESDYSLIITTPFGNVSKEISVISRGKERVRSIPQVPVVEEESLDPAQLPRGKLTVVPSSIAIGESIEIEVDEEQVSVEPVLARRNIQSRAASQVAIPTVKKRSSIVISGTRDLKKLKNYYDEFPEDIELIKPQRVQEMETQLNARVAEVLEFEEERSSLRFKKREVEVLFENISNEALEEIEVVDYQTAKSLGENFTTPIISVNATNFTSSTVRLPKVDPKTVTSILRCNEFVGTTCLSGWQDNGLTFTQNATHVSFVVDQFSAYVGSGPTYNFTVEFTSLDDVFVREDNTTDINITLSCADGNCGTLNVTLYILENFTFFDSFESGLNASLWQAGSSNGGGRSGVVATGTCGVTPNTGTNYFRMDRTPSGTFTSNYLKTVYDFTELRTIEPITYFIRETADEDHTCGDHTGDTCNGEGFFYTCDGNQWYQINAHTGLGTTFTSRTADVESDPDYCSPNSQNFSIKVTQYDNFACATDGIMYDDFNMSGLMGRQLNDSTSTFPFFFQGSSIIQQVSLNQDETDTVVFTLNASGNPGTYQIYAVATAAADPSIRAQSTDLNISIQDQFAPNGTKLNPIDGYNASINEFTITFNASAEDDTALGSATLYIYDDTNATRFEVSTDLTGTSDIAEWNITFVESGIYTWDVEIFDAGGLSNFTEGGRFTVNVTFPYVRVELFDPKFDTGKIENQFFNFTVNVTCFQNNCDEVNVSLLYPSEFNFSEGFENATLDGSFWENGSSDGGGRTTISSTGTCGVTARTGSNFFRADRSPSGTFTSNYLKTVYDFTNLEIKNLSFYIRETGDEDHTCGDHFGDTCSGEGVFFTCNGNQWFQLEALTGLSTAWTEHPIDITQDPDFCSSITSNFAIKWTQYDNFPCTSDGHYYDDINISVSGFLDADVNSGTPFWVNDSFKQTLSGMVPGESRLVTFVVNASGTPGESREFLVRTNSTAFDSFSDTTDQVLITVINASTLAAPQISYIDPTPSNGSRIGSTLYVNVSVNTTALDFAVLELQGVNYTMSCGGSAPDLYCFTINDTITSGNYTYRAIAVDILNQTNSTELRSVEVITDKPTISFVFPTPADGAITSENITIQTSVGGTYNRSTYIDFNNTLQGYWNFENMLGNVPSDNSTYGRSMSAQDIIFSVNNATRGGNGLFNTTAFAAVGSSNALSGYDALTIEAWVRPESTLTSPGHVVAKRDNSFSSYGLMYETSGTDRWRFFIGLPTINAVETPLTSGVWQHVVGVYNKSHLVIYVDGVEQNSTVFSGSIPIQSTIDVLLGARRTSGTTGFTEAFNGSLDEIRLWSRALTPDEVLASYDASAVTLSEDYGNLVPGQFYDFHSCIINEFGNQNCTEERTIQIGDSIPVIQTIPENNTKYFVGPGFNVTLLSDVDLYSVQVYLDGDNSTLYNLINFTAQNWTLDMTDNISFGTHNITFLYNQSSGFSYNLTNVTFTLLRNFSIDVTKNIENAAVDDQYIVNLTLTNNQNTEVDVVLHDFVEDDFAAGLFNILSTNSSTITLGTRFNGTLYSWNITLTPFEVAEINYTLIGAGDYYNIERYIYGLE